MPFKQHPLSDHMHQMQQTVHRENKKKTLSGPGLLAPHSTSTTTKAHPWPNILTLMTTPINMSTSSPLINSQAQTTTASEQRNSLDPHTRHYRTILHDYQGARIIPHLYSLQVAPSSTPSL
ncbi:hypothetical protein ElyMa_004218500 [Elysia marginata]|uniref:Uncharacterized protein n=1 Tax=Elysia marginata TaxID=1093978 RepID=A0AAV4GQR9_9GAST|nr:hypothetical protein ElyMa_004218500 [Elysia marginata]